MHFSVDLFQSVAATFSSLGFRVEIFHDETCERILTLLKTLQDSREDLSCLALFILTHGEDNGTLYASDAPYRLDRHIISELTSARCPALAGKPKLVFVQACQGKTGDPGAQVKVRTRHTSYDGAAYRIPHYADILVFQAAYHGHYSFRLDVS